MERAVWRTARLGASSLLGRLDIKNYRIGTEVLIIRPPYAVVRWSHQSKIAFVSQFLERRPTKVWLNVENSGNPAARDNLDLVVIKRRRLNNSIHWDLSHRKGSILNTGSPVTASFQFASKSSLWISIQA